MLQEKNSLFFVPFYPEGSAELHKYVQWRAHPARLVDRTRNSPSLTLLLFLLHGSGQGFYLRLINQKAVSIKTQIVGNVVIFALSSAVAS